MARKGTVCKTITLPDGTRKWVYGKTKKEVEEKIRELNHLSYLGIDVSNTQTFGEYVKQWFETYKVGKVAKTTLRNYRNIINCRLLPTLSGYKMRDITPAHIQSAFNTWQHLSENSLVATRVLLRMIFSSAVEEGIMPRTPVTKNVLTGGVEKDERTALTPEQTEKLLSNLKRRKDYLFCVVALNTGMRIGELTGLRWNDVDLVNWTVTVSHALGYDECGQFEHRDTKSKRGHRIIPINKDCVDALQELRKGSQSIYVFTSKDGMRPMTNGTSYTLRKHLKDALGDDSISFHTLRHTYCTRLFDEGKLRIDDISYLMGHADVTITLKIYAHYQEEVRFKEVAEKIQAS